MPKRAPKYRLHRGSGQALVQVNGKRIYLGKHGSAESKQKYRQILDQLRNGDSSGASRPKSSGSHSCTVDDSHLSINSLLLQYWKFAEKEYVRDGKATDEQYSLRAAMYRLRELYGPIAARDFGPKSLKVVQESMIAEGLSRAYINDSINRIKRIFRWGVSEELIPVTVYEALRTVRGLRKGRGAAREAKRVVPVSDEVVDTTLRHLSTIVADMVRMQRLTGARPGEVCRIRPCDVDRQSEVWAYVPDRHKTEHYGHNRVIFIGPKAQNILRPYLLRAADADCFSPIESEKQRNGERRARRKSPMTPSQARRRRKKHCLRSPRSGYDVDSYRRAIHRACAKAFPAPKGLSKDDRERWRKSHQWSPNQLRHTAATEIRNRFGIETSTTVLGHDLTVDQLYGERNFELARQAMLELG